MALSRISRILVFLIVIVGLLMVSFSTIYVSRPTNVRDDNNISINDSFAFDGLDDSFAFINDTGNMTFYTFDVGSHLNSEDIKNVDLILLIETNNFTSDSFYIKYSDDGGLSWNDLYLSNENLSKQVINFSLVEHTDNDWTWNEISGDLQVLIGINNRINGSIKLYELWLNVTVDDNPPVINLESPSSGFATNNNSVTFFFNVSDELSGIYNCSLLINGSVNSTRTDIVEGITQNFSINMSEGYYSWSVECYDNSSVYNRGESSERYITIDNSPPLIELISPENNSVWNKNFVVNFSFIPSDLSVIDHCDLYINDSLNKTVYDINKSEANIISVLMSNGFYSYYINCSDQFNYSNVSQKYFFEVDVDFAPVILNISVDKDINLVASGEKSVYCNVTVTDPDGVNELSSVRAVLYHYSSSSNALDSGEYHYTNDSCELISTNTENYTYSCGFSLMYYARPGEWFCNATAIDIYGVNGSNETNTSINNLYAAEITPLWIDYGLLNPGYNSSNDETIIVYNRGNSEIDIALTGYAYFRGDGLAMNCSRSNISIEYEHYSLIPGMSYSSMNPLSTATVQLDDFNLGPRTDSVDSYKYVYWKLGMPKGVKGNCSGYVVVSIVPS